MFYLVCFCAGVLCLLLYHVWWAVILSCQLLLLFCGLLIYINHRLRFYCGCFALGYLYVSVIAFSHVELLTQHQLDQEVLLKGQITSFVKTGRCIHSFQFLADVHSTFQPAQKYSLSWYGCQELSINPGQRWQLLVRLKPLVSLANPGSYDAKRYAFISEIAAKGYVKKSKLNHLLAESNVHSWLLVSRNSLYDQLNALALLPTENSVFSSINRWLIPTLKQQGISINHLLSAITIGVKTQLSHNAWALFRKSGTSHLIAISGLHVGIVFGGVYFISLLLSKLFIRRQQAVAQNTALVISLCACWIYSALAGFSLPTLRAVIMLSTLIISKLTRSTVSSWLPWWLAMALCLMLAPLQMYSAGFWLSFAAVAWLIYGLSGRLHSGTGWSVFLRAQALVIVGLLPLCLLLFNQFSWLSPIANMFAIPWLSFLVMPTALLGLLFLLCHIPVYVWLFKLCATLLACLVVVLSFLTQHMPWQWFLAISSSEMILIAIGLLFYLRLGDSPVAI